MIFFKYLWGTYIGRYIGNYLSQMSHSPSPIYVWIFPSLNLFMFRGTYGDKVRGYCFSTPGTIVAKDLLPLTKKCVMSFVVGDDAVTRASYYVLNFIFLHFVLYDSWHPVISEQFSILFVLSMNLFSNNNLQLIYLSTLVVKRASANDREFRWSWWSKRCSSSTVRRRLA